MMMQVPTDIDSQGVQRHTGPVEALGNFSIVEFCKWAGFSRPYYYVLKKEQKTPVSIRLGKREIIPIPNAIDWRKKVETGEIVVEPVRGVEG